MVAATANAQPSFRIPIDGVLGTDVILVNHVDHDDSQGVMDYQCGVRTYDGHQGTDFVLTSFARMDSGVAVRAAAGGVVLAAVDSLFDRNKISVKSAGFGNYVSLQHPQGYVTHYAHLRKGSVVVQVGDTVVSGAKLGLVGSSGNSSDPHLHFEVWKNIDPLFGACSQSEATLVPQPRYDTAYTLLASGLTNWPATLDTLREQPPLRDTFAVGDTSVTFWSLQRGVRAGDQFRITWTSPSGIPWFSFSSTAEVSSEYYYWWSYITRPSEPGIWQCSFSVNGVEESLQTFRIPEISSADGGHVDMPGSLWIRVEDGAVHLSRPVPFVKLHVYSSQGRLLGEATPITETSFRLPQQLPQQCFIRCTWMQGTTTQAATMLLLQNTAP
jgi:hypothetical protein